MRLYDIDNLGADAYSNIWNAYEAGITPPRECLPAIYTDIKGVLKNAQIKITEIENRDYSQGFLFVVGERGSGKTISLQTIGEIEQERTIPVYIDLGKNSDQLSILRSLFYGLMGGVYQSGRLSEQSKNILLNITEQFAVDLNFYKVRPRDSQPPMNCINQITDLIADIDMPVLLLIDELDCLGSASIKYTIGAAFEVLRVFNDNPRLRKFWVFGATSTGYNLFKERASQGCAFSSRIFQALGRHTIAKIDNLSVIDKSNICETVLKVLKKENSTFYSLISDYTRFLEHSAQIFSTPREIIGHTVSKIHYLEKIEDELKKHLQSRTFLFGALKRGNLYDKILKKKLLPLISDLFPLLEYNPNPNSVPSLSDVSKNRLIDGEFKFSDGFKLGIEIKSSEKNAILTKDLVDQIASYLVHNENSYGIMLLFGNFNKKPLTPFLSNYFSQSGILNRFEYKLLPRIFEEGFEKLLQIAEILSNREKLKSILILILYYLELFEHLGEIYNKHTPNEMKSEYRKQKITDKNLNEINTPKEIKLVPKLISGLGNAFIKKLNSNEIYTLQDLIRVNPDEIARKIRGISPGRAKKWITQAQSILQN